MIEPIHSEQLKKFSGLFAFDYDARIEHCVTREGAEVLLCDPEVPYPDMATSRPDGLVLSRTTLIDSEQRDRYAVRLPYDYLPLGVVVDESIVSFSARSEKFAHGIFKELGQGLLRLNRSGQNLASNLTFRQIIVEREAEAVRILPPLVLVPDRSQRSLTELGSSLFEECQSANVTPRRRISFKAIFAGFWDGIEERPTAVS